MRISPKQAIELEKKLNKTEYAVQWIKLGDILYEWRLHPKYNKVHSNLVFEINKEQEEWINKNITHDLESNKVYKLISDNNI